MLLVSSDPYLSSKRKIVCRPTSQLPDEVKKLLTVTSETQSEANENECWSDSDSDNSIP